MTGKTTTYNTDAGASCFPPSRRRDSDSPSNIEKKSTRITRGWPPERRAAQAARCRLQRLWQYARGPKTVAGKARSAQNALKHGLRSAAYQHELSRLRLHFRAHRALLLHIKTLKKLFLPSTGAAHHGFIFAEQLKDVSWQ